ncbi:MAG: PHP domain-containing protein [bacterium]|nr:PHP domain-containing protein [bacterium]
MENLREILNNLSETDYIEGKVNLHIHTSCSDGVGDYNQIISAAKEKGYKYIAITDHNTVEAHKHIQDDILITGVEFDCWFGYVFIHLLAYGIDINNEKLQPFLAKNKAETEGVLIRLLPKRNVKKLIEAIHEAGGIAVLAHPACYWALSLDKLVNNLIKIGLDGIETYYPYPRFRKYVRFHSANDVIKVANRYTQLIKTGGTDFHGKTF